MASKTPSKSSDKAPTKTERKTSTKTSDKASTKTPSKASAKTSDKASTKTPSKASAKTSSKAPAKASSKASTKTPDDTSNNQVIFAHDGGWGVRKEGSDTTTAVYETRVEALERAREIAENQGGEVYIIYTGEEETA